jgi:hypothetical protein
MRVLISTSTPKITNHIGRRLNIWLSFGDRSRGYDAVHDPKGLVNLRIKVQGRRNGKGAGAKYKEVTNLCDLAI